MISDEIASAVARFFDGRRGPSHDELTRLFQRFGFEEADPARLGNTIGKMKRVRQVLSYALDHDKDTGGRLIIALVAVVKAAGGFRPASEEYAGEVVIQAAREAFRTEGYELDPEGNLRPLLLENLDGPQITEALRAYVRRAQVGSEDAALVGYGRTYRTISSRG